jgi:2,3,4,5-tetrahydropyridine-2,6-dicarboxylate N-succinyltransferase (EC 2.3.1.117)
MSADLAAAIARAWEARETLGPATRGEARDAVEAAIAGLDDGSLRVAEKRDGQWVTHQWLKQAVLLSFRLSPMALVEGGPGGARWWDKVGLKTAGWDAERFAAAGARFVPGAIVRRGAFVAPGAVLMPCFLNIGARVGERSMIDTWATWAAARRWGRTCISRGGAGIGGGARAAPGPAHHHRGWRFIGARSEVAEGAIVGEGAVLAMGVFLGASTKVIDRASGETFVGRVPPYAVVVPGALPGPPLPDGTPGPALACGVIVKRVDARTRAKTAINELLRD